MLFAQFRTGELKCLVVSKVANFSIDLPEASIAIQVSGTFGSRQEEAKDWEEFSGLNQMAELLVSTLLSRATQSIKTLHKSPEIPSRTGLLLPHHRCG